MAVAADRVDLRTEFRERAAELGRAHLRTLDTIRSLEKADLHRSEGHRSSASYIASVLGISRWKAARMVATSKSLTDLPLITGAIWNGSLSLDKAIELTRFATAATEEKLLKWAHRVSAAAIRERGNEHDAAPEPIADVHRARAFRGWFSDERDRYYFEGMVPSEQGVVLETCLKKLARELPDHPEHATDPQAQMEQRMSDALVALVSGEAAGEGGAPEVVLHLEAEHLTGNDKRVSFGSALLHPDTVNRLSCDCRLGVVLHGTNGNPLGIGNTSRVVPRWLRRQVLKRTDGCCSFPGCEMKTYLKIHHIQWVARKGPTDYSNLIAVCGFHHDLVHTYGWSVMVDESDQPVWFRPGGIRFEPGVPLPQEPLPLEEPRHRPAFDGPVLRYLRLMAAVLPRSRAGPSPSLN